MANQPPIFLIAHPRSGTHALTSMIAQRPNVFVFGEVFNPSFDSELYPANYYHYLNALQDTPIASPKNAETRFSSYLAYLSGRARNARFLVDIKYDTLHLFDCELRDVSAPPSLFKYMSDHGLAVVHLKRNIFHVYVSLLNATATNQWQVGLGEEVRRPQLIVDIEHMRDFLQRKTFEQQQVSRYVRSTENHIEVWYHQLFGPGAVGAFQNLSSFLGVENLADEKASYTKQITQPYSEVIDNFDDVVIALKQTEFASLLD